MEANQVAELKEESNSEGTVPGLSYKGQFTWGKLGGTISKICS